MRTGSSDHFLAPHAAVLVVALLLLFHPGCGEAWLTPPVASGDIAVLKTSRHVADRDMLASISNTFFAKYGDEYDMLVFWGSPAFGPGHSFYLPVRNDVPGIGYQYVGPEFFDDSAEFGGDRLEGIIWMGPSWIGRARDNGPNDVLGVLAHETAHRWGATVHVLSPGQKAPSDVLQGSPYHWSFFLDTGASPLGGNRWVPLVDGGFVAEPTPELQFAPIDLYLMGLLTADQVPPLRLLTNVRSHDDGVSGGFHASWPRVKQPLEVYADVLEIPVAQIIDAEGVREYQAGFGASRIRQAWVYVIKDDASASPDVLSLLEKLLTSWPNEFSVMTQGRSLITTTLKP